jgi:hypothetical protein
MKVGLVAPYYIDTFYPAAGIARFGLVNLYRTKYKCHRICG